MKIFNNITTQYRLFKKFYQHHASQLFNKNRNLYTCTYIYSNFHKVQSVNLFSLIFIYSLFPTDFILFSFSQGSNLTHTETKDP